MKKKQKAPKPQTASTRTLSTRANTSSTARAWKSIRIDRPFPLPTYVKEALQVLNDAGHIAFIVGGSVRDFLLNRETKDYDIATSALPGELCRLFPNAITVGKAFGVIKVPTKAQPPLLEIATFRQDLEYKDHRHPVGVIFSGPEEDAHRRDFTVNALFYDPKTTSILDFTSGYEDLNHGVIRAIGNPSDRFKEDALRLLRAVRFKTRLGFKLDSATAEAVKARARLIAKVSAERIRDELSLIWTGPNPNEALQLLSELGLLPLLLPEVEALKGLAQIPSTHRKDDVWNHLVKTLRFLNQLYPVRSSTLSWAALLHEIGKPVVLKANEGKSFNGHEIECAKTAEKIALRLKMSKEDTRKICAMLADHLKFKDVFQMRESTLQRFIRDEHFEELLFLHHADAMASDGNLAFFEFCSSRLHQLKTTPSTYKLIDGKDLIQLGFKPGPEFSEILHKIEDLALEKKLLSKEEALEYVIKTYVI